MKRVISTILVCLFLFASVPNTYAAEVPDNSLDHTIQKLSQQFPNATISVDNGTINVVIPQSDISRSTFARNQTATRGGSWKGFTPPLEYILNPSLLQPYCIVFLPADLTEALVIAMGSQYIKDFIIDQLDLGISIEDIVLAVLARYGLALSYAQVFFLAYNAASEMYSILNIYSLNQALGDSTTGRVSIQFCTMDGWPTNLYYAWNSPTYEVYATPWEAFNPEFYPGDYSGVV